MIISHARRFIFIKTIKTAGTSLEIVLSKYCGEDDIITPIVLRDEELRKQAGGLAPRNYEVAPRDLSWARRIRRAVTGRPVPRFIAHTPAWKVRREIGPEIWDSYFKFSVVRHPVDRCLSRFHWTRDFDRERGLAEYWDAGNFDQFVQYRPNFINENWPLYTERGQVTLDHLVKYEDFEAGLGVVSEKIGLGHNIYEDLRQVRAKGSHRPKGEKPDDVVSDRHRQLISLLCEKEIELFDYKL